MARHKTIPLFFWSSKVFEGKAQENYGDLLSTFIVDSTSHCKSTFYNAPKARKKLFKKSYLMGIGSILKYASSKAVVWGSGIISKEDVMGAARFCAVRGPLSRKRIQELGHDCPEVYGDPALLLPLYYTPKVSKKYTIGIVPHYVDYDQIRSWCSDEKEISVINLLNDNLFETTDAICACDAIISSSLHGVIVAHAYGIPALWVQFSNKLSGDNCKYEDYFRSVGMKPYEGKRIAGKEALQDVVRSMSRETLLPNKKIVRDVQTALIAAFPDQFKC